MLDFGSNVCNLELRSNISPAILQVLFLFN